MLILRSQQRTLGSLLLLERLLEASAEAEVLGARSRYREKVRWGKPKGLVCSWGYLLVSKFDSIAQLAYYCVIGIEFESRLKGCLLRKESRSDI